MGLLVVFIQCRIKSGKFSDNASKSFLLTNAVIPPVFSFKLSVQLPVNPPGFKNLVDFS
jgi:hypothetical protein